MSAASHPDAPALHEAKNFLKHIIEDDLSSGRVAGVEAATPNPKLTAPGDLAVVEALIAAR
ncbi:MAG: hypothetical protein ACO3UZ_05760 [Burkholderiaceae bacterium]